jgi:urease alpha subunit
MSEQQRARDEADAAQDNQKQLMRIVKCYTVNPVIATAITTGISAVPG